MAGGGGGGAQPTHKSKFGSPVPRRRARIEIIPLIDVMFFLLAAFMMVSLSMQKLKTPKLELPTTVKVTAGSDFKPNAINVAVDRQGQISVGKTNLPLDRLDEMLTAAYKRSTNNPVFVSADRETAQGDVNRVLYHVRTAGFQRVSFSVSAPKGQ
jgi:biopolymer transport protein ExbD